MDSYYIKLNVTHSQIQLRLAEIRFDLRHTIRQVKVRFLRFDCARKLWRGASAQARTP